MSKEIQKKESNALSNEMADWGQEQRVSSSDIVIDKILVMQHMSEKVTNKEADFGEFRSTGDNKLFGSIEKPFEFIPIDMNKFFIEYDIITSKSGQRKRDFSAIVPIQDNPTQPGYNDEAPLVEGDIERDRVLEFYVLIPEEVAELGKGALPYILSFRRTSMKAGKQLATQMFVRNRAASKAPAAVTMQLSAIKKENDDGQFAVLNVKSSRETTPEEMAAAFVWYKAIKGGQTKVDHSDLGDTQASVKDVSQEF